MIDWGDVLANSTWVVGLALLLAGASFESYLARVNGLSFKEVWTAFTRTAWSRLGALLFCAGMALTAASWVERGLWALLCLGVAYSWWRGGSRHAVAGQQAPQPVQSTVATGDGAVIERGGTSHSEGEAHRSAAPAASTPDGAPVSRGSGVSSIAEWLVRLELPVLALVSPFFLFPAPERVLPLAVMPLLWMARRVARKRFVPPTPLDWAIALLLVMVLVSMYATFDLALSLGEITLLLFGIGLYYALVEWNSGAGGYGYGSDMAWPRTAPSASGRLAWTLTGYLLAGVGLAAVGLLGTEWANKLPGLGQVVERLPAVLRDLPGERGGFNPNIVGGALLWIVPLQLALAGWSWTARDKAFKLLWPLRLGLLSSLAISATTLVFTQSRGAVAGFALGTALLLWLVLPLGGRLALAGLVAAGMALGLLLGPQQVLDSMVGGVGSGLDVSSTLSSGATRLEIWARALYGIEDFPFTGMGMGTFVAVLPVLYPIFSVRAGVESTITHAHNQFLQAALDLGLPGLVAFIAVWLLAGRLVALAWRASTGWRRAASAGIGAGLLASLVFGMTDTVVLVSKPSLFFWALLALLVALWQHSTHSPARGARAE